MNFFNRMSGRAVAASFKRGNGADPNAHTSQAPFSALGRLDDCRKLVEIVCPLLHHFCTLGQEGSPVVGAAQ
jgi:hypothetical protein